MFHDIQLFNTSLHHFLNGHSEALQNAVLVIGGRRKLNRTQRLLDDIGHRSLRSRWVQREIQALYRLLSLQDVPESEVFGVCCLDLDPGSAIIEDICILTDALADAMRASGLEPDDVGNAESDHETVSIGSMR